MSKYVLCFCLDPDANKAIVKTFLRELGKFDYGFSVR